MAIVMARGMKIAISHAKQTMVSVQLSAFLKEMAKQLQRKYESSCGCMLPWKRLESDIVKCFHWKGN